jgi:hypothetical protein
MCTTTQGTIQRADTHQGLTTVTGKEDAIPTGPPTPVGEGAIALKTETVVFDQVGWEEAATDLLNSARLDSSRKGLACLCVGAWLRAGRGAVVPQDFRDYLNERALAARPYTLTEADLLEIARAIGLSDPEGHAARIYREQGEG